MQLLHVTRMRFTGPEIRTQSGREIKMALGPRGQTPRQRDAAGLWRRWPQTFQGMEWAGGLLVKVESLCTAACTEQYQVLV